MQIRTRMMILVLLNLATFAFIAAATFFLYLSYRNEITGITEGDLRLSRLGLNMELDLSRIRRDEKNYLLFHEERYLSSLKRAMEEMDGNIAMFGNMAPGYPDIGGHVTQISEEWGRYKSLAKDLAGMSSTGYQQFNQKAREITENMEDGLAEMESAATERIKGKMAEGLRIQRIYSFCILGGLGVVTTIWALWGGWFWLTARRRLERLTGAARQVMQGAYQGVVEPGIMDEIGQLTLAFNEMRQRVAEREDRIEHLNADLIRLTNQMKSGS